VPLDDVSGSSGDVQFVENLLDTPEMIVISSNDEEPKDQLQGDPKTSGTQRRRRRSPRRIPLRIKI